jgi:hypothetical protein
MTFVIVHEGARKAFALVLLRVYRWREAVFPRTPKPNPYPALSSPGVHFLPSGFGVDHAA